MGQPPKFNTENEDLYPLNSRDGVWELCIFSRSFALLLVNRKLLRLVYHQYNRQSHLLFQTEFRPNYAQKFWRILMLFRADGFLSTFQLKFWMENQMSSGCEISGFWGDKNQKFCTQDSSIILTKISEWFEFGFLTIYVRLYSYKISPQNWFCKIGTNKFGSRLAVLQSTITQNVRSNTLLKFYANLSHHLFG